MFSDEEIAEEVAEIFSETRLPFERGMPFRFFRSKLDLRPFHEEIAPGPCRGCGILFIDDRPHLPLRSRSKFCRPECAYAFKDAIAKARRRGIDRSIEKR